SHTSRKFPHWAQAAKLVIENTTQTWVHSMQNLLRSSAAHTGRNSKHLRSNFSFGIVIYSAVVMCLFIDWDERVL
ncbi:MAG: hypothetical protein OEY38_24260, partial [Gammaproteobacteria bacterium]|nr:hypothetical protein [Gammaproteobacteria bacterium]